MEIFWLCPIRNPWHALDVLSGYMINETIFCFCFILFYPRKATFYFVCLPLSLFLYLSSFFWISFLPPTGQTPWLPNSICLCLRVTSYYRDVGVFLFSFLFSGCWGFAFARGELVAFSVIVKSASTQWFVFTARGSRSPGLYSVEFPSSSLSALVLSRFCCFLPQSRKLHVTRMGNSKLFVCRSECVSGCVCRCSL